MEVLISGLQTSTGSKINSLAHYSPKIVGSVFSHDYTFYVVARLSKMAS